MKKQLCLFFCIFFFVLGCDQSVNMLLGVGQALDSESPQIKVTSPENGNYVKKSDITITGTCSDNVGVTKISVSASASLNGETSTSVSTESISLKSVQDGTWSVTFDKDKLDRELNLWRSGLKVTFTVTCYDAAGNFVVEHIFLYVDTNMPEVTINKPEIRFSDDEMSNYKEDTAKFEADYDINTFEKVNSFVNKEFTIKGYVDDNYSVKSTYINIYDTDKKQPVATTPIIYRNGESDNKGAIGSVTGNSQSWEFKLDSMKFCETEGWYALEVVTEDEAGNERKQFVDKNWIYVNQAADIPKNNFTSFSEGLKLNAGNVMAGYSFDDDGMREVWIKIVPESQADANTPYTEWKEVEDASHITKKCTDFTIGTQMGNWSLQVPSKAGNYTIYAVPVDINGICPQTPYEGIYVSSFSVASEEDPVVGIDSTFRGSTIVDKATITGYFYDNNAVTKISVAMRFNEDEDVTITELYTLNGSKNNIKITKTDDKFQLTTGQKVTKYFFEWEFDTAKYKAYKVLQMTFRAEDEDNYYGEDAITVYGDSERPTIGETSPANNTNILDKNVFSGAVSDNVDVVKVTISAKNANGDSAMKDDIVCTLGEKELLSSGKYKRTFISKEIIPEEFGGYVDREFTITAIDAAGNEATRTITLKGDKTKPTVRFTDDDGNEEGNGKPVAITKILNVRLYPVTFEDGSSRKITKAVYTVNRGAEKELIIDDEATDRRGKYFSAKIKVEDLIDSLTASGGVTLQVVATDEGEYEGEGSIFFIVDNTAPVMEITSHKDGVTVYGTETNIIRGTTTDSNKITELKYALTKDEKTPKDSEFIQIEENDSGFSRWEINFSDTELLNEKLKKLYNVTGEFKDEPYDLYLWMKAADEFDNVATLKMLYLKVNAVGDKPTVYIEYPTNDNILGGTITVSGTTEIATNKVKQVYLQIDPDYKGSFASNWEIKLKDYDYKIETDNPTGVKGIAVTSTSKVNWRLMINSDKKLDGDVALKAIAVSDTGKHSESKVTVFKVDKNIPQFTDLKLVLYNGSEVVKSRTYSSEMWITGSGWCIEGNVTDENGIEENSVKVADSSETVVKTGITDGYHFKIPVTTDGFGSITLDLEATDKSQEKNTASTRFEINYDNTPPEFSVDKLSEDNKNRTKIENTSGVYTIDGVFKEESKGNANQSGFERIAMYFTRTKADGTYIIDSMLQKGDNGKANHFNVSDFAKEEGIYWITENDAKVDGSEITLKSDAKDIVRVGGLCKVDGIIYKINEVNGPVISLNESLSNASTKTVYFAAAQVIDNLTIESGKTTYYGDSNTINYDDGDKMVEGVVRVGTTYEWTASINSENIFDGSLEAHFVAFDKAGNYTAEYVRYCKVSNNAPRIAGVTFGTDNNGNDKVDSDELNIGFTNIYDAGASVTDGRLEGVSVNGKLPNGTKVTTLDLPLEGENVLTTVKGFTSVTPKIVGEWSVGNGGWSELKELSNKSSYGDTIREESGEMNIAMIDFLTKSVQNSDDTMLRLRIWDNTEGCTAGTDSQYVQINIRVKTVLVDTEKPIITILPFYWNSSADNCLYENSRDNGHIELEADLPSGTFTSNESDIFDRDPKVSGKITINGTARDNVLLKTISLTIPDILTKTTIIQRDNNGNWSSDGNMETKGWACEVYDEEFSVENGNTIKWKLHLDTEKMISAHAKADVQIVMQASDRGKASVNGNAVNYTSNASDEAKYQMDVVPYITEVTTSLSSSSKRNPTVFSRSAHGVYPVRVGETVTLNGFNLGSDTVAVEISKSMTSGSYEYTVNSVPALNNKNNNEAKGAATALTQDNYKTYAYNRQPNDINNNLLTDDVSFAVWEFDPAAAVPISGKIEQPVMKINPVTGNIGFAFVNGPLYFSMGGKVKSGSESDDANATTHSYNFWMGSYDFFTSVGFVYDKLGYSYGCAAGGDINSSAADKFKVMSSRWGLSGRSNGGSYGKTNSLRLESIGQNGDADGKNTYAEIGTYLFDKQRIKSPSMATTVNADGKTTNLYMAYYDAMNEEIRFKAGATSSTGSSADFGDFTDYDTAQPPYIYRHGTVSMIAGSKTGRHAGEYVSIAAIPGTDYDVVAVVWYADRTLWYSYTTSSPMNRKGQTDGSGWSTPVAVFSGDMSNSGEYCKIVADEDGGIHIAAYDPINLDLVYAYSSSYSGSFKTCVVDSNGVTGSNLTLDVAKVGSSWRPYIGYYETSCVKPKYAYKVSAEVAPDGAEDGLYTLAWECMVLPTESTIEMQSNQHNDINIGVWKENNGVLKNSTTGAKKQTNTSKGFNSTSYGTVWGNGTDNPVLGYAIKSGTGDTIETAQLK